MVIYRARWAEPPLWYSPLLRRALRLRSELAARSASSPVFLRLEADFSLQLASRKRRGRRGGKKRHARRRRDCETDEKVSASVGGIHGNVVALPQRRVPLFASESWLSWKVKLVLQLAVFSYSLHGLRKPRESSRFLVWRNSLGVLLQQALQTLLFQLMLKRALLVLLFCEMWF